MLYDPELEKLTIGAVLHDNSRMEYFNTLTPEDFYDDTHKNCWKAIGDLMGEGLQADAVTLGERLNRPAIGHTFLNDLVNYAASSRMLKDLSQKRKVQAMIQVAGNMLDNHEMGDIMEYFESQMVGLHSESPQSYVKLADELRDVILMVEDTYKRGGAISGITTGFKGLDDLTDGFHKSEFVVVGARPSVGKSAITLNMALQQVKKGSKIGYMSAEMPSNLLIQRLLSEISMVNQRSIRNGLLAPADFSRMGDGAAKLFEYDFFIYDKPNMKLSDLKSQARRLKMNEGIECLYVDYLTLISPDNRNVPRHEQVAEMSRSFKALARELEIPVIVASQLKRESEDRTPQISDLRESGSIEQDADMILLLSPQETNNVDLIIAKNRNGPQGLVPLYFSAEYTMFKELER